ncbi:MAG: GtrA family protein [Pseudomonadota bacterium]
MSLPASNRILKYALAAVAATIANIGAQWLIVSLLGNTAYVVYASVLIGTAVGLVAKFLMDKFLIFRDSAAGRQAVTQVTLYLATGIFTTIVFWAIELAFHYAYQTDLMRYVGGVLGLAVGYTLKYMLDSRFVFREQKL